MATAKAALKTQSRTHNRLAEVSEDVLQAGIDLVHTARDEAGRLIRKVEKNAGALRRRVEGTLEDLPEVDFRSLPGDLRKGYTRRSKQAVKAAEKLGKRLVARTQGIWKDVATQVRRAGDLLETGIEPLIHSVGLASKSDLRRLESRLAQLSRRVHQLEKRR